MFCEKCGSEVSETEKICPKCGFEFEKNNKNKSVLKNVSLFFRKNLNYVYYIIAILILIMFMVSASRISSYGSNIASIESVGGKTLEEAYYSELGGIYAGYATVIRGLGITLSSFIVWLGIKLGKEKHQNETMSKM